MPGLIDSDTGLTFGDGLNWLEGGLGGPSFDNPPSDAMVTELGIDMVTEDNIIMVTES